MIALQRRSGAGPTAVAEGGVRFLCPCLDVSPKVAASRGRHRTDAALTPRGGECESRRRACERLRGWRSSGAIS